MPVCYNCNYEGSAGWINSKADRIVCPNCGMDRPKKLPKISETFTPEITTGYDSLRAKRLGLPKDMKAVDDTLAKKKIVRCKRKSCQRDKETREKLKNERWGLSK